MKGSIERKIANYTLVTIPVFILISTLLVTKENAYYAIPIILTAFFVIPSIILAKNYVSFRDVLLHLGASIIVFFIMYILTKQIHFLKFWSVQTCFIFGIVLTFPALLILRSYLSGWQEITGMKIIPSKKEDRTFMYFEKTKKLAIGLATTWLIFVIFTMLYCYQFKINDVSLILKDFKTEGKWIDLMPIIMTQLAFLIMIILTTSSFVVNLTTALKKELI